MPKIFSLEASDKADYLQAYAQTYYSGGEIDLILHRGKEVVAIEIKSSSQVDPKEAEKLRAVSDPLKPTRRYLLSLDPHPIEVNNVRCLHWRDFCETELR